MIFRREVGEGRHAGRDVAAIEEGAELRSGLLGDAGVEGEAGAFRGAAAGLAVAAGAVFGEGGRGGLLRPEWQGRRAEEESEQRPGFRRHVTSNLRRLAQIRGRATLHEQIEAEGSGMVVADERNVGVGLDLLFEAERPVAGIDQQSAIGFGKQVL